MPHGQEMIFLTEPQEDRTSSFTGPFRTASAPPAGKAGDPGGLGPGPTQAQHLPHSSDQPASVSEAITSGHLGHLLDTWLPAPSLSKFLPR